MQWQEDSEGNINEQLLLVSSLSLKKTHLSFCLNYFTLFLLYLLGKSFQQQREAMKQTIEEDKEPEKSGWTLIFDINERFLGFPSGIRFKFAYQNCQGRCIHGKMDVRSKATYLRTVKKRQDLSIKDYLSIM